MRDRQLATSLRRWNGFTSGCISSDKPHDCKTLSDVLETGHLLKKYYLSPKACRGILRRAEKRGKALPLTLAQALQEAAGVLNEPGKAEDKTP